MYIFRNVTICVKTIARRSFSISKRLCTIQVEKQSETISTDEDYTNIRKENSKSLRIAILGAPNAGKSTLINELVNYPVCAASSKVHTTRASSRAVFHINDTELVFVDTPGVVSVRDVKKHKLEGSFRHDPVASRNTSDIVGVVHDVSRIPTRETLDPEIMAMLNNLKPGVPSLLLLNKVDKLKSKRLLLNLVDILTSENQWPNFSDVFMMSALHGDGIDDFRDYLLDAAKHRQWEYDEEVVTDQKPEELIVRLIRGDLMNYLPAEIPYSLDVKIEYFNISDEGTVFTYALVECPSERIYKLVLRILKRQLKGIAMKNERELARIFCRDVRLKLVIKSKTPPRPDSN